MDWFKKHVGQRIKCLRQKAGYNQTQFGQMLDLSRVSVLNIEQGRHQPTLFGIYTLCSILNCRVEDIMPPIQPVNIKSKDVFIVKKVARKQMKPVVIKKKPSLQAEAVNKLRREAGCSKSLAEKAVAHSGNFDKQIEYIRKNGPRF